MIVNHTDEQGRVWRIGYETDWTGTKPKTQVARDHSLHAAVLKHDGVTMIYYAWGKVRQASRDDKSEDSYKLHRAYDKGQS